MPENYLILTRNGTIEMIEMIEMIVKDGHHRNAEEFSLYIERRAKRTGERYLDIINEYCDEEGLEPELIAKSISPSLKEKLKDECERLHLIKSDSYRLPE